MGKYYLVTTYYSKAYLVFYKEGLQLLLLGTESIRLFKALKVRSLRKIRIEIRENHIEIT